MYRKQQDKKAAEKGKVWRGDKNHYERHYCELCNVWMAKDRASIVTHEHGKQHVEKVKERQAAKTAETVRTEKHAAALQQSLAQMEAAAAASQPTDYALFAGTAGAAALPPPPPPQQPLPPYAATSSMPPTAVLSRHTTAPPPPPPPQESSNSKKEWDALRRKREAEKKKKRKGSGGSDAEDSDKSTKRKKVKIGKDEGHYVLDDCTWLEGVVFGDILEEDMKVQLWLGPCQAAAAGSSMMELRLPENQRHWKDGLVAAPPRRPRHGASSHAERAVVDVAYLEHESDERETLQTSVPLAHIRILLGNKNNNSNAAYDERIPDNLEEARLLAMGGEEIIVKSNHSSGGGGATTDEQSVVVDDATGLSGWSTVKIKRTTARNELKQEREALRRKRKAAGLAAQKLEREREARRMEEAKVSNANDSALGAYDIWSRGATSGYKGVDIHASAAAADVADLGKKLAEGKNVGFKRKPKRKLQNRRTTSADDD